jgi:hypothetical protein
MRGEPEGCPLGETPFPFFPRAPEQRDSDAQAPPRHAVA